MVEREALRVDGAALARLQDDHVVDDTVAGKGTVGTTSWSVARERVAPTREDQELALGPRVAVCCALRRDEEPGAGLDPNSSVVHKLGDVHTKPERGVLLFRGPQPLPVPDDMLEAFSRTVVSGAGKVGRVCTVGMGVE